jgi:cytochrome c peroxidase
MPRIDRYCLGFVLTLSTGLWLCGCERPKLPHLKPDPEQQQAAATGDERDSAAPDTGPSAETAEVIMEVVGDDAVKEDDAKGEPAKEDVAKNDDAKDDDAKGDNGKDSDAKDDAGDAQPQKSDKVLLGSSELFAGIPGEGPLKTEDIDAWYSNPANTEVLDFDLPLGLAAGRGQVVGVDKNPLTRAKIELGRQLYFDPRLSADESISCASCHDPSEGFARNSQFGLGIRGQLGGRNSPVSYNRILSGAQFWDGRAPSLEAQAIGPIANPIEMGHTHEACVACLKGIKGYKSQFDKIFGDLTIETVGEAIASFERAVVTGPSPFDYNEQFRPLAELNPDDVKEDDPDLYEKLIAAKKAVEEHPMSESALRGREIFFTDKGSCTACHVGANLTDEKFHNLGVGMDKPEGEIDRGRAVFSLDDKETGAFKTPTIRNVALSPPYMHDGSHKTLEEVVEWYAKGGFPNDHLDPKIKKLDLTDQDKKDLVEFMKACTGDFPKIEKGRLPE